MTLLQVSKIHNDTYKNMAARGRGQFLFYNCYRIFTLKIFLSETTGQIGMIFSINSLKLALLQVSYIHDDI